ncbi:MAG: hypothetical protein GOV15_02200 [Candidatus Diapherotrites archaeon]|nr:hypothetical protein [Candidatus Diapherotrites archaeon]
MKYELKPTNFFLEQIQKLSQKSRHTLKEKLLLAEQNPFRLKILRSKLFSHAFRIRIKLDNTDCRIVLVLIKQELFVVCILDRKKDYKDLKQHLTKLKKELKQQEKK